MRSSFQREAHMENSTSHNVTVTSKLLQAMAECPVLSPGQFTGYLKTIFLVVNIVSSIIAVAGNSLVVLVFVLYPGLRRRSNSLLLGLAASDFLVGSLVQTLASLQVGMTELGQSCVASHILIYSAALMCGASAWVLCLISYDRYLHLAKLTDYCLFMSTRKLRVLLALCWLYPIMIGCLGINDRTLNIYFMVVFVSALATMSVIFTTYFLSWRVVRESSMKAENEIKRKVSRHWKVAKSVAIIIACYVCAWMPLTMWTVFYLAFRLRPFNIGPFDAHAVEIYHFTLLIGFTNSCVNPILYYWRNAALRDGVNKFFSRAVFGKKDKNQKDDIDTSTSQL